MHPEVMVFQVPERIEQLPEQFAHIARVFDGAIMSEEDRQRNQMYKQNQLRKEEQQKVQNIGDFLGSTMRTPWKLFTIAKRNFDESLISEKMLLISPFADF